MTVFNFVFRMISRKTSTSAMRDGEINMNTTTKCVLIACGSFNPVTNMHLRMFGKFYFVYFSVDYFRNVHFLTE